MSAEREEQVLRYYREHRIDDQLGFYQRRSDAFDRATGQALFLAAVLLGFATAASALAGTDVAGTKVWAALATILPALSTALGAYTSLHAFERQSKIYGDAIRAVHAASRSPEDPAALLPQEPVGDLVKRVESALRQEHAQWGQLTASVGIVDETKG